MANVAPMGGGDKQEHQCSSGNRAGQRATQKPQTGKYTGRAGGASFYDSEGGQIAICKGTKPGCRPLSRWGRAPTSPYAQSAAQAAREVEQLPMYTRPSSGGVEDGKCSCQARAAPASNRLR
jgi:hypothetical protein